ncbi:MAG: BRCT domain-containing protein [Solibacillus sp.]
MIFIGTETIYFHSQTDFRHPFLNKTIVFTGALATMTRRAAAKLAIDCGAVIHGAVTEHTDFVVLGDKRRGISTKQQRAEKLIHDGAAIQLLVEDDFLWILSMQKGMQ